MMVSCTYWTTRLQKRNNRQVAAGKFPPAVALGGISYAARVPRAWRCNQAASEILINNNPIKGQSAA